MFVWVFHRISGIGLIGLLLLQLLTGFCQAVSTDSETARTVAASNSGYPNLARRLCIATDHPGGGAGRRCRS